MDASQNAPAELAEEASLAYLGRWNRLVSTTNWEKGRIIHEWRQALVDAGSNPTQFSDEAWARYVSNVSGQHVGRLRRVWERFGAVRDDYDGLYWSHFQAALDWDDAEMWLEGAVQNDWSVSAMRRQRWETLGGGSGEAAPDADLPSAEFDEDAPPFEGAPTDVLDDGSVASNSHAATLRESRESNATSGEAFDEQADEAPSGEPFDSPGSDDDDSQRVAPLAALPELPDDLAEAFESYKLAILHHKMSGWRDIARNDVIASLRALEQLALAP